MYTTLCQGIKLQVDQAVCVVPTSFLPWEFSWNTCPGNNTQWSFTTQSVLVPKVWLLSLLYSESITQGSPVTTVVLNLGNSFSFFFILIHSLSRIESQWLLFLTYIWNPLTSWFLGLYTSEFISNFICTLYFLCPLLKCYFFPVQYFLVHLLYMFWFISSILTALAKTW